MQRILSTYLYKHQRLMPALLAEIAHAGIPSVEIFCGRFHFDYGSTQAVCELGDLLAKYGLQLHGLHAPTERDAVAGRGSGVPMSIADPERIRRMEAVDETKRALEVAERIPFRFFSQHLATGHQAADPRKFDAAFSSLEQLTVFAKQRGVTIALQNTPNDLGSPASLVQFVNDTHLHQLRFCFDIGHAHIQRSSDSGFHLMRDRLVTMHVHDNKGEKDDHLPPYEGTIDWDLAIAAIANAPEQIPLVLELKEQSPGTPSMDQIRASFDKLQKHLEEKSGARANCSRT